MIIFLFAALLRGHNNNLETILTRAANIQVNEHKMKIIYKINVDSCFFVGDIRGDLMSLYIALDKYNTFKTINPSAHIVFLGDYTGGGDYNVKCLETIVRLKLNNPSYVHLCRGNHETTDSSEDNSILPELKTLYNEDKANNIYASVGYFYASLSPILIINESILCCHGMIPSNITRTSTFKFTPGILEDKTLIDIVWSNYPAPIAEDRPYGHNVSPKELLEICNALHITKVVKAHDYSGSGNHLEGSGISLDIITSSIKKGKETTFYKYNDTNTPTREERVDSHDVSKYILCASYKNNKIEHLPYLEYNDKKYIQTLGFVS